MTKRIQLTFLLTCLLLFTSCGNNPQDLKIKSGKDGGGGGDHDGSEKPVGTPTPYDVKQFKKGQVIVWERTEKTSNSKKKKECVVWTFVDVDPGETSHLILGHYSTPTGPKEDNEPADCSKFQKNKERQINFNLHDGVVREDKLVNGGHVSKSDLKSIYDYLYGSTQPVHFEAQTYTAAGKSYSTFQVWSSQGPRYFNQPGHPFHGVILSWTAKEPDGQWIYQLRESDPEIPYSPASAMDSL
ncbi:MAG: hypothetical protein ACAH59_03930 [Pseudobdellovibrionaceae bacterium]